MFFVRKRKFTFILSSAIILAGLISFIVNGMNLGIDFAGGSILQVDLHAEATIAEVQTALNTLELDKETSIQQGETDFYIRTQELSQEQTSQLVEILTQQYPDTELLSADTVGAAIGNELTRNAVIAVLLSAVLMLIYISLRFELTFGIAAVVGILHNVLIVLGVFSFLQIEINTPFIAAILTVLGYSINDTIVIFDRIRAEIKLNRRAPLEETVDRSVASTLNRSINTVLTSLLPLITLFVWGGDSLQSFVLVMIIGFLVGCYSSIFIASPLWYVLKSSAPTSSGKRRR
jgi:preprotein translocase subunit SecF